MSFKALILYDLSKYLILGNEMFLERFVSLCHSFSVDIPMLLAKFSTQKHAQLIAQALNCKKFTEEIELSFPENAMRDLIRLKLSNLSVFARRSTRLSENMRGVACITKDHVHVHRPNESFNCYLLTTYSPLKYSYSYEPELVIIPRSKVIFCGCQEIPFYVYMAACVVTNTKARVTLTESCLDALLDDQNAEMLESVFTRGKSTALNIALQYLFHFLRNGSVQDDDYPIDLFN